MWFKNFQLYRLSLPFDLNIDQLNQKLGSFAFAPCNGGDLQSEGWLSPRENDLLAHQLGSHFLMMFGVEKKLLPASVINQVTKARAVELEEQQGFPPGRKAIKNLKELVREELLPRAFSILRTTRVWIDSENGWLVIDTPSASKADEVLKGLLKVHAFSLSALKVNVSPQTAMTEWLATECPPKGFTLDQNTELRSSTDDKAAVRYVNHSVDSKEVQWHIEGGKRCTKLALTWNDRISFSLTDSLVIKQVKALELLVEKEKQMMGDADERLDADFVLMANEVSGLLDDLVFSLGGESQLK